MSIIVTGCAGFIASRVAEMLLEEGKKVIGIDNINDAYDVSMKNHRMEKLNEYDNFEFHRLDITDTDAIFTLLLGSLKDDDQTNLHNATAVIHLAARAGVRYSCQNPWIYTKTNVDGTVNMLEVCRRANIKKFVLASTSSLYAGCEPPFKETVVTETPQSPYAASKKGAEAMCYTYHHLYKIDVSALRFFTVYGPAGRPDMMPFRFVQWISEGKDVRVFGDGTQSRDFTYVDDIARGVLLSLKNVGYEVINLGSDDPVGLMDAIQIIEKHTDSKANLVHEPRHPADPLRTWAVVDKARDLLGWKAEVSFDEGIGRTVEWYKANRDWARSVST